MDDDPQKDLLDLTAAERVFRKVADDARADTAAGLSVSDTAECYRLVVDELDRLRARLHVLEGEGPERERDVDSTVLAALTVAVSEIDWDYPLLRGHIIRLTQRAVMQTLRHEGYLPPARERQDDEVSDQRRIRAASDDLDRALTALQASWEAEARDDEPVDEKGRGETYRRGFADGRTAERAGTTETVDETHVWGPDEVRRAQELVRSMRDQPYPAVGSDDPPPFAPELADAPIVTGESGAPAPLVVDQPVHESTLPAELEPQNPPDGERTDLLTALRRSIETANGRGEKRAEPDA